jgi:transformation/transcription domain-associated protein
LITTLTFLTLDAEIRIEAAIQLSNNIEHYVSSPTYAEFLKKFIPIFINCLKSPPVFIDTSPEQVKVPRSN